MTVFFGFFALSLVIQAPILIMSRYQTVPKLAIYIVDGLLGLAIPAAVASGNVVASVVLFLIWGIMCLSMIKAKDRRGDDFRPSRSNNDQTTVK